MNWKEQFIQLMTDDNYWGGKNWRNSPQTAIDFIEDKIIEKLIDEIPDYSNKGITDVRPFKRKLKKKWLNN